MKLLIITQIVDKDDAVLGFFHGWIKEFAKNCEKVTVICLKEGKHELPENVKVLSLGKNLGVSKFKYLANFYKYIWVEHKNYDFVFVHMNPEYIILGGFVWRLLRKKIGLWYAHGTVTFKLRFATFFSNIVFTSTSKGCRLSSKKIKIVGQGIDCERFSYSEDLPMNKVCTVGRISRTKNLDVLIQAIALLKEEEKNIIFDIYGECLTGKDREYEKELAVLIKKLNLNDVVRLCGPIIQRKLPDVLKQYGIFLSAGQTGSLDKAILEAAAVGRIVISSNSGAFEFLNNVHQGLAVNNTVESFKISVLKIFDFQNEDLVNMSYNLNKNSKNEHSIVELYKKIVLQYEK